MSSGARINWPPQTAHICCFYSIHTSALLFTNSFRNLPLRRRVKKLVNSKLALEMGHRVTDTSSVLNVRPLARNPNKPRAVLNPTETILRPVRLWPFFNGFNSVKIRNLFSLLPLPSAVTGWATMEGSQVNNSLRELFRSVKIFYDSKRCCVRSVRKWRASARLDWHFTTDARKFICSGSQAS